MHTRILFSRFSLALLFLSTLIAEAILLLLISETTFEFPEIKHLVIPYQVLAVFIFTFVQIGLFGLWQIVSAVKTGVFYEPKTRNWFNLVLYMMVAVLTTITLATIHLLFIEKLTHPGLTILLFTMILVGVGLLGLAALARHLYLAASEEHQDLQGVI